MQTQYLSWKQAKNRLATGLAKEVMYQNGVIARYLYIKEKWITKIYDDEFEAEPNNPQYLFRVKA